MSTYQYQITTIVAAPDLTTDAKISLLIDIRDAAGSDHRNILRATDLQQAHIDTLQDTLGADDYDAWTALRQVTLTALTAASVQALADKDAAITAAAKLLPQDSEGPVMSALADAAADYAAQKIHSEQATEALRVQVRLAAERGMTEAEIARVAGVTRMTVRSWLGK